MEMFFLQNVLATDIDINGNPAVQYTLKSVDVTSGSKTVAQVQGILDLRANGEVYINGVVTAGDSFVITVQANDNPLDTTLPVR